MVCKWTGGWRSRLKLSALISPNLRFPFFCICLLTHIWGLCSEPCLPYRDCYKTCHLEHPFYYWAFCPLKSNFKVKGEPEQTYGGPPAGTSTLSCPLRRKWQLAGPKGRTCSASKCVPQGCVEHVDMSHRCVQVWLNTQVWSVVCPSMSLGVCISGTEVHVLGKSISESASQHAPYICGCTIVPYMHPCAFTHADVHKHPSCVFLCVYPACAENVQVWIFLPCLNECVFQVC